jgi:hypothetical protein
MRTLANTSPVAGLTDENRDPAVGRRERAAGLDCGALRAVLCFKVLLTWPGIGATQD